MNGKLLTGEKRYRKKLFLHLFVLLAAVTSLLGCAPSLYYRPDASHSQEITARDARKQLSQFRLNPQMSKGAGLSTGKDFTWSIDEEGLVFDIKGMGTVKCPFSQLEPDVRTFLGAYGVYLGPGCDWSVFALPFTKTPDANIQLANTLYILKTRPAERAEEKNQPEYQAAAPEDADAEKAREAFKSASSANTMQSYNAFLSEFPDCSLRPKALAALSNLIKEAPNPLEGYWRFVRAYPDGRQFVPAEHNLYVVGPQGLTVHDIIDIKKKGVGDGIIAAKISITEGEYKDFTFDEIGVLQKKGISDRIVEAMLQSTAKSREKAMQQQTLRQQQAEQKKKDSEDKTQHEEQRRAAAAQCKQACKDQYNECMRRLGTTNLISGGSLLERAINLASNVATAKTCVDVASCNASCEQ